MVGLSGFIFDSLETTQAGSKGRWRQTMVGIIEIRSVLVREEANWS